MKDKVNIETFVGFAVGKSGDAKKTVDMRECEEDEIGERNDSLKTRRDFE